MNHLVTLVSGLVFGFGLAMSGMTNPQKVLNFLDITGSWDPSLLFVLGGAVGVTVIAFRFIGKLAQPVFAEKFYLTDVRYIDRPLLIGSALFGIGWGIGGYCPGPAIALMAAPNWELYVFVPAMLAGYAVQHYFFQSRQSAGEEASCG
jgi:uncharacterized membrane protein YedE/YeeE